MCHSEWIGSPSNGSFSNIVDDVPKEVEDQLKDLKEAAEGDAKPKGETTSQCAEQASILKFESYLSIFYLVSCLSILTDLVISAS